MVSLRDQFLVGRMTMLMKGPGVSAGSRVRPPQGLGQLLFQTTPDSRRFAMVAFIVAVASTHHKVGCCCHLGAWAGPSRNRQCQQVQPAIGQANRSSCDGSACRNAAAITR